MAGAKRNGADGAWESSGIVEGKEGEAAGITGDWAGKGGEVEEDAESGICAGRTGSFLEAIRSFLAGRLH